VQQRDHEERRARQVAPTAARGEETVVRRHRLHDLRSPVGVLKSTERVLKRPYKTRNALLRQAGGQGRRAEVACVGPRSRCALHWSRASRLARSASMSSAISDALYAADNHPTDTYDRCPRARSRIPTPIHMRRSLGVDRKRRDSGRGHICAGTRDVATSAPELGTWPHLRRDSPAPTPVVRRLNTQSGGQASGDGVGATDSSTSHAQSFGSVRSRYTSCKHTLALHRATPHTHTHAHAHAGTPARVISSHTYVRRQAGRQAGTQARIQVCNRRWTGLDDTGGQRLHDHFDDTDDRPLGLRRHQPSPGRGPAVVRPWSGRY
jgi:hypothetical protein